MMADSTAPTDASPKSAVAIVTFSIIITWNLTIACVFGLLFTNNKVESVMVGILGAIISSETAALAAVTGFWLANSLNSNRSSAAKDVVIAAALPNNPLSQSQTP